MSKSFFLITVISACILASCASRNTKIYEPRYEILSEKFYEGERTSVILQRFPDTPNVSANKAGIPENSVSRAMLLYLPDTTYKDRTKPDPFGPISKYYFTINKPDYITVNLKNTVRDSTQFIVLQDSLAEGNYLINFRRYNVESGVYYLEFKNRDTVIQRKVLLIK